MSTRLLHTSQSHSPRARAKVSHLARGELNEYITFVRYSRAGSPRAHRG